MALEVTEVIGKSSGPDNFTEMPTVAGVPVVESGSNSDGEWVRWADGTQHCSHNVSANFNAASFGAALWTFPVSFITAADSFSATCSSSTRFFGSANDEGTATDLNVILRHHLDTSGTYAHQVSVLAKGRWK